MIFPELATQYYEQTQCRYRILFEVVRPAEFPEVFLEKRPAVLLHDAYWRPVTVMINDFQTARVTLENFTKLELNNTTSGDAYIRHVRLEEKVDGVWK